MNTSICPGMTVADTLRAMGQDPPEAEQGQEPAPKRARAAGGKFRGDNPATPEVNEAWEPES